MNMTKYVLALAFAVAVTALAACNNSGNSNSSANGANTAIANPTKSANSSTSTSPASTDAKTDVAFSLATPTDAYKTAYDCRKRKDIECLKKVMSKDIQDFLVSMGEDDKKSLDTMLKELCERPQAATNESRNEAITGSTATIEYPDENGEWHTMDFEKVDAGWQMSAPGGGPKPADRKSKKP